MADAEQAQPKIRSVDELAEAANLAVHFSNKTINSNIPGGGVRLGPEDALDLPYISARTLLGAGYVLDYEYTTNNGILNSVLAIASGENQLDSLPAHDAEQIRQVVADQVVRMKERHEVNTDTLDPRHRQLLVPDPAQEHGYVCLTPITSVSVCKLIQSAVSEQNAAAREALKVTGKSTNRIIPLATMGFGGAKFMNVGRLTSALKNVPVFIAPRRNFTIRAATAIHYRGVSLQLPELVMIEMADWVYQVQTKHDGTLPIDMTTRERLEEFAAAIAHHVCLQVARGNRLMRSEARHLPDAHVSDEADSGIAGLHEQDKRGALWRRELAAELCSQIISFVGISSSGMNWGIELEECIQAMLTSALAKELPL